MSNMWHSCKATRLKHIDGQLVNVLFCSNF